MQQTLTNIKSIQEKRVVILLAIMYSVAVIGFSHSNTRSWFIFLTPYMLFFNSLLLYFTHKGNRTKKLQYSIIAISILGFCIEVIGVKTQAIFGQYYYEGALGFSIFETPILIGLNWALLSYLFAEISNRISHSKWIRISLGTIGMLMYDLILEQVAPALAYWDWYTHDIPLQNYVTWGVLALLFQSVLVLCNQPYKNKIAPYLTCFQMGMFLILIFTLT